MRHKPLLSICIPTYNRADLLQKALQSVVPQTSSFGDLVEIIVSDNCSSDHTPNVVNEFLHCGALKYNRNECNIGAGRNFLLLTQSLAQGEFCWIIGDDDLVREGAVSAITGALLNHPQVDYAFVNSTFQHISELEENPNSPRSCIREQDALVEKGEQIINFGADGVGFSEVPNLFVRAYNTLWRDAFFSPLFSYLGSHVIRTHLWREQNFSFVTDNGFPSMEATFPHACMAVRAMVGKPSIYLGRPQVIVRTGTQEWDDYWPLILTVRIFEFSDFIAAQGADRKMVRLYRNMALKNSSELFWRLLLNKNTLGRDDFNAKNICQQYWTHSGLYIMLVRFPAQAYIRQPIRRIRNLLFRLMHNKPTNTELDATPSVALDNHSK